MKHQERTSKKEGARKISKKEKPRTKKQEKETRTRI